MCTMSFNVHFSTFSDVYIPLKNYFTSLKNKMLTDEENNEYHNDRSKLLSENSDVQSLNLHGYPHPDSEVKSADVEFTWYVIFFTKNCITKTW